MAQNFVSFPTSFSGDAIFRTVSCRKKTIIAKLHELIWKAASDVRNERYMGSSLVSHCFVEIIISGCARYADQPTFFMMEQLPRDSLVNYPSTFASRMLHVPTFASLSKSEHKLDAQ